MCNYNGVIVKRDELIRLLEIEKQLKQYDFMMPAQTGFDYPDWPVIVSKDNCDWEIKIMQWGFLPEYVWDRNGIERFRNGYTDKKTGKFKPATTTLNARGEDLFTKKIWSDAALHRRCLVLSSGFYEWRHVEQIGKKGLPLKAKAKFPYHIKPRESKHFLMAGIWQPWKDLKTAEYLETFAIVTTEANRLMAQIHNSQNRMPTILPEKLAGEWISDGLTQERISELATWQIPPKEMEAFTIRKDFRDAADPLEAFSYENLPALELEEA